MVKTNLMFKRVQIHKDLTKETRLLPLSMTVIAQGSEAVLLMIGKLNKRVLITIFSLATQSFIKLIMPLLHQLITLQQTLKVNQIFL
jgi:hypothetical protein